MEPEISYIDLGLTKYKDTWDYQERLFREVIEAKLNNKNSPVNYLIFCEHYPVFTIGKSGSQQNLLINETLLKQKRIDFYRINRGGDITFHGPGQIVGYPILDLEQFDLGIKNYIFLLEQAVIETLKVYGIEASRLSGATGVWLDPNSANKARKICAIGVKASRHVTMHGFAFNVNTDLDYYQYINPCGFIDKGVTSMEKELGRKVDFNEVKDILKANLVKLLQDKAI